LVSLKVFFFVLLLFVSFSEAASRRVASTLLSRRR